MPTAAAPRLQTATIVSREYRPPGFWCVGIRSPEIARRARPAQFVAFDLSGAFMMRLPLGIFSVKGDDFTVLFQEWGERTTRLAHTPVGESISCLGPLGNEFTLPQRGAKAIVVAGGLGVSPFWLLARELREAGASATVVLGARSADRVVGARDLAAHGFPVEICTDDGSAGFKGTVVDRVRGLAQPDVIYACGPPAMLRAVCDHATAQSVACQISMEETFGCSMGTCWGCVVAVRRGCAQGTGYPRAPGERRDYDFARICRDGTVFNSADVVWQA
jgi:dihydroorotate dehydrogenase electron transfer subunit